MTDSMRPLFPLRDGPPKPAGPRSTQNYFSFADSCIHVADHESTGTSPLHTLFFLHGRLEDSSGWQPLIERLRVPGARARCLAVDFPGFGRSVSARRRGLGFRELVGLVKQVIHRFTPDGTPSILVARDAGGAIAQACAADPESNVRAVVLVNSTMLHSGPRKVSWLAGRFLPRRLERVLGTHESFGELRTHWSDAGIRRARLRAINALAKSWPSGEESRRIVEGLKKRSAATLVLWGGSDSMHPLKHGLELMSLLPDASFFADERLGHWPEIENTDWISGRIREFLFHLNMRESSSDSSQSISSAR